MTSLFSATAWFSCAREVFHCSKKWRALKTSSEKISLQVKIRRYYWRKGWMLTNNPWKRSSQAQWNRVEWITQDFPHWGGRKIIWKNNKSQVLLLIGFGGSEGNMTMKRKMLFSSSPFLIHRWGWQWNKSRPSMKETAIGLIKEPSKQKENKRLEEIDTSRETFTLIRKLI